jgi:hypothetical protein
LLDDRTFIGRVVVVTASRIRLTGSSSGKTRRRSSFRHLLFLLRAFHELWFCGGVAVSIGFGVAIAIRFRHLFIAIALVTLMVLVVFLAHFRLRVSLEILVDALIVFVCASTICDLAVTRGEIVVL